MINRTVRIIGQGYGSIPAAMKVVADGKTIFAGTVPTVDSRLPVNGEKTTSNILCTFELPVDFEGTIPITVEVVNGIVVQHPIMANYYKIYIENPIFNKEELKVMLDLTTTHSEKIIMRNRGPVPLFTQEEKHILSLESVSLEEKQKIRKKHGLGTPFIASSGPDQFGHIFRTPVNLPTSIVKISEPCQDVTIDGNSIELNLDMWPQQWPINADSVLAYNLKVSSGYT